MSRFAEAARFAVRGVLGNKMRSALTTLGILIGVAAVIILVSVGTGSSAAVSESISSLGSNTLTVTSSQGGTGGRGGGGGGGGFPGGGGGGNSSVDSGTQTRLAELTVDDAGSLIDDELAPDVKAVAPTVSASSVTATYTGASHDVTTFTGTTPSYLGINDWTVAQGSAFSDADYTERNRVALVGVSVAEDLAGGDGSDILDQTVQFNGVEYSVVGILAEKGTSGNTDQDDVVIAPLTAVQDTLTGYGSVDSITVQATSAETVDAAQSEVEDILNSRHKTTSDDADFSVSNASSFLEAATSTTDTLTVLLAAVAAISLLVGGIGVMNIMLVTVTERTREIGIRKAIGAQKFDIVSQFLIEAVLLSVFGGLMGVLIGVVGSQFTIVGVEPVIAPYSVVLSFGVSVLIGLFFGLYPANRAASLRPIDALRYE
ncbi:ABC transporter permease [Kineosporia sp. J2-2]|uniref:ABC transporter permease n=1 Tax=Kineosporia corallincola TaxID=2835133 RepID=A0ABS5TR38_9ACTN|nr:ABC transporter permease [Kineosporia corallincola]MBT0773023.1 ABC transporter permease [Kineosporia corallincola]